MSENKKIISVHKSRNILLNILNGRGFITKDYDGFSINEIHSMFTNKQLDLLLHNPTIDKTLTFMDITSKTDEAWYFGIIEVSNSTYSYLKEHPDIKFTKKDDNFCFSFGLNL